MGFTVTLFASTLSSRHGLTSSTFGSYPEPKISTTFSGLLALPMSAASLVTAALDQVCPSSAQPVSLLVLRQRNFGAAGRVELAVAVGVLLVIGDRAIGEIGARVR